MDKALKTPDDIMEAAKRDAANRPGQQIIMRLNDREVFKVTYIDSADTFECSRSVDTKSIKR